MSVGGTFDFSAFIAVIGDEVSRWNELVTKIYEFTAENACNGALAFGDKVVTFSDLRAGALSGATVLSDSLADAVERFVMARGESAPGVIGGRSLGTFIAEQGGGCVPWLALGLACGPLAPVCVGAAIASQLPSGSDLLNARSNKWSSTSGSPVPGCSGLYLTGGKLTGPTMSNWISDWISEVGGQNGPSPSLFPFARDMLIDLVGTYRGTDSVGSWADLRFWKSSNGGQSGSRLVRLQGLEAEATRIADELYQACGVTRGIEGFGDISKAVLPFAAILGAVLIFRGAR